MNDPHTGSCGIQTADLSSLVESLFSHKLQVHLQILQQIKQEIVDCQSLHEQILHSINAQITKHRNRQLELEGQMKTDWSLWLHPRRAQLEQQVSEWEKQRLYQLTMAWEHIDRLKREYRAAWKECQHAFQTQLLLHNITGNRYYWHPFHRRKQA